jgi:hypothetical protein
VQHTQAVQSPTDAGIGRPPPPGLRLIRFAPLLEKHPQAEHCITVAGVSRLTKGEFRYRQVVTVEEGRI